MPSASAILARMKNSLSDRRVISWALARISASRARMSLSEKPSCRSSMTSRLIGALLLARDQVGGQVERRRGDQSDRGSGGGPPASAAIRAAA